MTTIKDIAKQAGVSHGTVSNVLNGRGNVSVKKIKLVEDAAKKLGYHLNLQAKILKEGAAKTISVVLPNISSQQYANLYDGLFHDLNQLGYELTLYLTYDSRELEQKLIEQIAVKRDYAVIAVSSLDNADSYYQKIKIAKEKIIFVYRQPESAVQFITLDYEKAGADIASEIMKHDYKRIGLLSNSEHHTHAQSFKKGLQKAFNVQHYPIELKSIESIPSNTTYNLSFSFFTKESEPFDALITMDIERARYLRNASYFGSLQLCPPIYTLTDDSFFYENNFYQYHMNYGMLSQQIISLIKGEPVYKLDNKGFFLLSDQIANTKFNSNEQINVLIIPSPSTEALKKLLPHFEKMSGIKVNLIIEPFDKIYHILNELEQYKQFDIIRIDMAGLPWFAPKVFKPLSDLNLNLTNLFSRYLPEIVKRYSYVNNTAYALPFDPSVQMLFYRKDLFEDPLIKRSYFEKYRQHLGVPVDFKQFNQIASFFNQAQNPESPIEFGSCITLGNDEIIASEFLVRYYAQGGELFSNQQLGLDCPIAIETLTQLQSFMQIANKVDTAWWQESVNQFEQGRLAMIMVYVNLFSYINHRNILPLVGYAQVPGNSPLFGGGSLGISKYSKKTVSASLFFDWIYSKEISEQIALLGGTTAQNSILQNQRIIKGYPWLKLAQLQYANGKRENYIGNQAINLRHIEHIIGRYLSKWIKGQYSSEQVILKINSHIKKEYC
ncbi:transcriptional regulator, LacI family [Gilliamella bombicola]|uniref:Transcriptional regulator, LacI family n=1 Tax=Gilliamella bombicola TaxID=1798182 RepID=A0A1C4CH74_9GAMM|nr:extracellular solute-binding protein [Gilliamella bombicola]SCC18358.1 transcriptional regulator, LacI family [Gilliamella bombicola]